MIINFVVWSPLISLLAITFLYPLRYHYRGHQLSQFYAALFAFPAMVSSLYLLGITYTNGSVTSKTIHAAVLPLFLTVNISLVSSLILVFISLSIATTIFIPPKTKFTENTSLLSLSFIIIFVIAVTPDHFVKMSALSIGSIAASFFLLQDGITRTTKLIVKDFCLQRISDFLALTALVFMLANAENQSINNPVSAYNTHNLLPILLLNISALIRVFSLLFFKFKPDKNSPLSPTNLVLRTVIIGVGSQLAIMQFRLVAPLDDFSFLFLLIPASLLLLAAIVALFFYNNKAKLFDDVANIFMASAFISTCMGLYAVSTLLICCVILFYPIFTTNCAAEYITARTTTNRLAIRLLIINRILLITIIKTSKISAKFFTNLINPVYSGFFFFYLPQILITTLQIPLRLFHNGNTQRSLVFAALMIVSYIYWWGK